MAEAGKEMLEVPLHKLALWEHFRQEDVGGVVQAVEVRRDEPCSVARALDNDVTTSTVLVVRSNTLFATQDQAGMQWWLIEMETRTFGAFWMSFPGRLSGTDTFGISGLSHGVQGVCRDGLHVCSAEQGDHRWNWSIRRGRGSGLYSDEDDRDMAG
jgi:hypothetical protein